MKKKYDGCPFCTGRKLTKMDDLHLIMRIARDLVIEASTLLIEINMEQLAKPRINLPTKSKLKFKGKSGITVIPCAKPRKKKKK